MIDWNFIAGLEGERLDGYVPDPENSDSGVTVASGVDLGQLPITALQHFSQPLAAKLHPYIGLRGEAAVAALAARPLTIIRPESIQLTMYVQQRAAAQVQAVYDGDAGGPGSFSALPNAAQTVMASVTFQYGTPWVRCPKFWGACIGRNWADVIDELNNFGDHYPTRREKEAAYLQSHLGAMS